MARFPRLPLRPLALILLGIMGLGAGSAEAGCARPGHPEARADLLEGLSRDTVGTATDGSSVGTRTQVIPRPCDDETPRPGTSVSLVAIDCGESLAAIRPELGSVSVVPPFDPTPRVGPCAARLDRPPRHPVAS